MNGYRPKNIFIEASSAVSPVVCIVGGEQCGSYHTGGRRSEDELSPMRLRGQNVHG